VRKRSLPEERVREAADEARDRAETALARFRELGDPSLEVQSLAVLARVAAQTGRPEEAERLLAGADLRLPADEPLTRAALLVARAHVAWVGGDADGARSLLSEAQLIEPNRVEARRQVDRVRALLTREPGSG
jgi:ATP/maltotriose-dependent transcriptional regulator MalT